MHDQPADDRVGAAHFRLPSYGHSSRREADCPSLFI
jgi:hypothetical protein